MKKMAATILVFVVNWQLLQAQQQALLEPADGKVYHGAQTMTFESGSDPLAGYLGALGDYTIQPAVRGFFFSIPGERGPANTLAGLKKFLSTVDSVGCIPEISLFMVGSAATDSIIAVSTQYDYIIDSIITLSKSYGRRMFVRIGGEFNGSGPGWNGGGYHPYYYVTMFRKITGMYAAEGFRDSIAVIWCYEPDAANDFDSVDSRGARWYPGDTYVDWFGLDVFNANHFDQSLPDTSRGAISKKGKSERFLSMARARNKPVYMSETSAQGMNISADSVDAANDWNTWFAKFWEFIDVHKEIKGFSYINANWPAGAYPGWGDARIQNSPHLSAWYRQEMHDSKYIHLHSSGTRVIQGTPAPEARLPGMSGCHVFCAGTAIRWRSCIGGHTTVRLFDLLGREAGVLIDEYKAPGEYAVRYDALRFTSGVYYYLVRVGERRAGAK